jgi:adenylate cyclase
MALAESAFSRAVTLNPRLAEAHAHLGAVKFFRGTHQEAYAEAQNAYALNPNSADVLDRLAYAEMWMGLHEASARQFERVLELDPFPKASLYANMARAYFLLRKYDMALMLVQRSIAAAPKYALPYIVLAIVKAEQGKMQEAQSAVATMLLLRPDFSVAISAENQRVLLREDFDRWISALRKAGFPER